MNLNFSIVIFIAAQTAKMSSEVLGPIQSPFFSSKDQRTEGWLMLDDPKLLITILACYVYLVRDYYSHKPGGLFRFSTA